MVAMSFWTTKREAMMPYSIGLRCAALVGAGLLALAASGAARAQMPDEAAEINACLCLQQGLAPLSAAMTAKTNALAAVRRDLADLDAELARARPAVEVNNPDSVARYKALLAQRDTAYQHSIGPIVADADQAVARYSAQVNEYNTRCANHPFDAAMMSQMQAQLSCPPLR